MNLFPVKLKTADLQVGLSFEALVAGIDCPVIRSIELSLYALTSNGNPIGVSLSPISA